VRPAAVLATAFVALMSLLAVAGPATASPDAEIGMEDQRLLLSGEADRGATARAWAAAGVDIVRLHARWSEAAPAVRRPSGFNGRNHLDPQYQWGRLDAAIAAASDAGLRTVLTITGPGPDWTSRDKARKNARYKPDPRAFGDFARAVATRYGARVDRYLLWNEPNQPGWLEPQSKCVTVKKPFRIPGRAAPLRRRCTPVAPHVYRELVAAALPAVKAADPGAQVLMGELAPIGRAPVTPRTPLAPLPFLRAMACVDESYHRLSKGPCARFRAPYADAIGHHPHGVRFGPDESNPDPTFAQIADLDRLFRVLDRLTAGGRLVAPKSTGGKYDVHLTEFGYQTSPPDHAIGVTLEQQARFLQQAAHLTWRHPRLKSLIQYQWHDEPARFRRAGVLAYAGWQSGLHFVDGRPKPALDAFVAPFTVERARGQTRFWGQVRPGGAHSVTLLRRSSRVAPFEPIATATTDRWGSWQLVLPFDAGAEYRFTWSDP